MFSRRSKQSVWQYYGISKPSDWRLSCLVVLVTMLPWSIVIQVFLWWSTAKIRKKPRFKIRYKSLRAGLRICDGIWRTVYMDCFNAILPTNQKPGNETDNRVNNANNRWHHSEPPTRSREIWDNSSAYTRSSNGLQWHKQNDRVPRVPLLYMHVHIYIYIYILGGGGLVYMHACVCE